MTSGLLATRQTAQLSLSLSLSLFAQPDKVSFEVSRLISSLQRAIQHYTYRDGKKKGPRLRETGSPGRGSRDTGSRNLAFSILDMSVYYTRTRRTHLGSLNRR